eukprot:235684-Rhodomonas_salina.2
MVLTARVLVLSARAVVLTARVLSEPGKEDYRPLEVDYGQVSFFCAHSSCFQDAVENRWRLHVAVVRAVAHQLVCRTVMCCAQPSVSPLFAVRECPKVENSAVNFYVGAGAIVMTVGVQVVRFYGNRCTHFTLPNATPDTRVSSSGLCGVHVNVHVFVCVCVTVCVCHCMPWRCVPRDHFETATLTAPSNLTP